MTFELARMTDDHRADVLALRVHDSQALFVEPIVETLEATAGMRDNHVMLMNDAVVGFFQIDATGEARFRNPSSRELELHEVMIDAGRQGTGLGRKFASTLGHYIAAEYPGWQTLVLSVNVMNGRARALYELGGFRDTGEIYTKGRAGPQNVMRLRL